MLLILIAAAASPSAQAGATIETPRQIVYTRFGVTTWDFEKDLAGWYGEGGTVRLASEAAISGASSLAVEAEFPHPAAAQINSGFDTRTVQKIIYSVLVPNDGPRGVRVVLNFKNKDGLWFERIEPGELVPGKVHTFEVDVSPDSAMLEGRGHFARWSRYVAHQMTVMGIKFFCPTETHATIYIDDIQAVSVAPKPEPLRITDLSVNTLEVERFTRCEVSFKLNREFDAPFDSEQVQVDADFACPDGRKVSVPGFFYCGYIRRQSPTGEEITTPVGKGCWKVRFTPTLVGTHQFAVRVVVGGTAPTAERVVSPEMTFACTPGKKQGFVRVSQKDPRYFEFTTGEFFYPIGHNFRSPNDPRCARMLDVELPVDRGTYAYDDMLPKMAANGENLFEVWMATWWVDLEWNATWPDYQGIGDYNLANAWKLDHVFDKAEELGLYIHLVLDNHGKGSWWCDAEWRDSPYRDLNGGFLHSPDDWFTSPKSKKLYKQKLRYILARWGYSPNLMGVEMWSEIDLTMSQMAFGVNMENGHPLQIAWHKEMIAELKRIDPYGHVVTTHYSANFHRIDPFMASLKELDYIVSDAYRGEYNVSPKMSAGLIMRMHAAHCAQWRKPTFVTEYGGNPYGADRPMLEADLHSGIWGSYMSTQAGSPLLWWFDYIDRENRYFHFKALAAFHKGEDRRGKNLQQAELAITGAPVAVEGVTGLAAMCLKGENMAYAWVYDNNQMLRISPDAAARSYSGAGITIPGLAPGKYNIEFWDTYKGIILSTVPVTNTAGSVQVPLPEFKRDIALKVKLQ